MPMQFTINTEYAKRYNEYRKKEELQKLKDRHGDVKLTKKRKNMSEDQADEDSADQGSSDSSSDSDDDEEYGSAEEREHEEFLRLYDALCRNDPALDDPNKQWFHEKDDDEDSNEQATTDVSDPPSAPEVDKVKQNKKSKHPKPVTLRDHERQFLLEHGGVEDEFVAADADRIAKLESDDVLNKLSHSVTDASKANFLEASEAALRQAEELSDAESSTKTQSNGLDFLKRRKVSDTDTHSKPPINTENLRFIDDNVNSEAETFLRDFIVNQRWKRPQERRLPTYSEVLRDADVDEDEEVAAHGDDESPTAVFNRLNDDTILDEDDDFLIKVHDFERENQGTGTVKLSLNTQVPKHRFEEEDKEYLKSYPRKITTSLHQSTSEGRSARSMKREARRARKQEQKKAKLAELARLRRLKLALLADKIERIKRSCGSGSDLLAVDLEKLKEPTNIEKDEVEEGVTKTALDLAEHLDEDWDPEKHDQLIERMFNDEYYQAGEDDTEVPQFSDASDLDSDNVLEDDIPEDTEPASKKRKKHKHPIEETTPADNVDHAYDVHVDDEEEQDGSEREADMEDAVSRKRARRRLRGKARLRRALKRPKAPYDPTVDEDYELYLDKHYKLTCEDVIPGPNPEEDLFCRFSYRQVTPNDYGLSTEEVLTASTGELNSWVPINRVTAYRSEEEEQRDLRVYHSNKKLEKKTRVIASLSNPDAHWWPDDNAPSSNKSSKKRKRSKRKRARDAARATITEAAEEPFVERSTAEPDECEQSVDAKPSKKKQKDVHRPQKLKGVNISQARLAACNITLKDIYRQLKRSKDKSSADNPVVT